MSTELDPTEVPSSAMGLRTSRRGTALDYVRDTLRRDILNGVLPGGTRLGQSDIAKQLGVSTTPVREALRDLASEGLVTIDPHRGGCVMELDREDVAEIYQIRQQLEPLALRRSLPLISDAQIERLSELNEEMCDTSHVATWVGLNSEFHMLIYSASERQRLMSIIAPLRNAAVLAAGARLTYTTGVREEANQEHTDLVDAIRRRDLDGAVAILQAHLEWPFPH